MLYHQTKFGCQRINSSENTVERVIFWSYEPHCDLDLEDSNSIFHMTLWLMMLHHHTIFGNKIFCDSENIIRIKIQLHYLKSSNLLFPQNTLAYDAVLSNKVWLQTDQQFRRYIRSSHILIIWALAVILTLKTVNKIFFFAWHSA